MPHIEKEGRKRLETIINDMQVASVEPNGDLNYVLTRLFVETVWKTDRKGYNNIKNFCGELEECAHYIRHRFLLEDYEKLKCEENGDVL